MKNNDPLGDRMKSLEAMTELRMMSGIPVCARVDGRAFSSFTRGLERPYDTGMSCAMLNTATALAKETGACMTYTQSDEITLVWLSENHKSQIWFDGRHSKMVSQLAALATLYFYRECLGLMPDHADKLPSFDARVWQVPSKQEAANVLLWREKDATKNSITMAASHYYSHRELHGKTGNEKQAMLLDKGINWNNYPPFFKRGVFIQKRTVARPFTPIEAALLPPKHAYHNDPGMVVERTEWQQLDMPPFGQVTNRVAVIFGGAEPETKTDEDT